MAGIGDDETIAGIIERVVNHIDERRKREAGWRGKFAASIPAWIAVALSVAAVIFTAGGTSATVAASTKDQNRLEGRLNDNELLAREINNRLIVIETTVKQIKEKQ